MAPMILQRLARRCLPGASWKSLASNSAATVRSPLVACAAPQKLCALVMPRLLLPAQRYCLFSTQRLPKHEPRNPQYAQRVRDSFDRQAAMKTLGCTLETVKPGEVAIQLNHREELTQQHGFLHAGVVATALDSACGYAAFSLMEPDAAVLTIEYKINLLAPAADSVLCVGSVVKSGRTIFVTDGVAHNKEGKAIATMSATIMAVRGKKGVDS